MCTCKRTIRWTLLWLPPHPTVAHAPPSAATNLAQTCRNHWATLSLSFQGRVFSCCCLFCFFFFSSLWKRQEWHLFSTLTEPLFAALLSDGAGRGKERGGGGGGGGVEREKKMVVTLACRVWGCLFTLFLVVARVQYARTDGWWNCPRRVFCSSSWNNQQTTPEVFIFCSIPKRRAVGPLSGETVPCDFDSDRTCWNGQRRGPFIQHFKCKLNCVGPVIKLVLGVYCFFTQHFKCKLNSIRSWIDSYSGLLLTDWIWISGSFGLVKKLFLSLF